MYRLWCLRARLPGNRDLPGGQCSGTVAAVHPDELRALRKIEVKEASTSTRERVSYSFPFFMNLRKGSHCNGRNEYRISAQGTAGICARPELLKSRTHRKSG